MMTPKERAAMKQALEALEACVEKFYAMKSTGVIGALPMQAVKAAQAITAMREALEKPAHKCDGLLCNDCGEYKQKYKDLPGLTEKDLCVCEKAEQRSDSERMEPVAWRFELKAGEYSFCSQKHADANRFMLTPENHTIPLYAAPQPVKQEPVAWRVRGYSQFKTGNPAPWRYVDGADKPTVNKPDCCDFEPLYAAPVRTKDLTDDEIDALIDDACKSQMPYDMFAHAVIAADREKNK